jgi:O-Antigen ligase
MYASPTAITQHTNLVTMDRVRVWAVSLVFLLSFMSTFQPAPTDYAFVLALLACFTGGLRFSLVLMPLLFLLLIYNLSGLISYMLIPHDQQDAKQYILGLAYTSFSGFFLAAYINDDPVARFKHIIKAYWVAAVIGSVLGLIGYFKLEPISLYLPEYQARAVGFFKDPNVFSTWLVLPIVTLLQGFLLGTVRMRPLALLGFLIMFAALFLSFSRGAWINMVMASAMMILLSFALSPSNNLRVRIVLSAFGGLIVFAILLTILLSIPETRETFLDRFTLIKSYDAGETGRFGNQINSLPLLLDRPLGLGPYQFGAIYGLAPHNTFLNSFASAGWVGGISFILFVVCSFIVGLKVVFTRTPFQPYAIAAFSCFVSVTLQGVQIDTEHWRHLYWMVGMVWGFYAASLYYKVRPPTVQQMYSAWNIRLPQLPVAGRNRQV